MRSAADHNTLHLMTHLTACSTSSSHDTGDHDAGALCGLAGQAQVVVGISKVAGDSVRNGALMAHAPTSPAAPRSRPTTTRIITSTAAISRSTVMASSRSSICRFLGDSPNLIATCGRPSCSRWYCLEDAGSRLLPLSFPLPCIQSSVGGMTSHHLWRGLQDGAAQPGLGRVDQFRQWAPGLRQAASIPSCQGPGREPVG